MSFCRLEKLEETLRDEKLTEPQKAELRQQHAIKETEFLRLKRSRLGVTDFEPLKVRNFFFHFPVLFCVFTISIL